MSYFLQLKQVDYFRIKSFDSKHWQKWDEATSKFLQSDSFVAGYSPKYVFRVEIENKEEKLIAFSREQLGQILIGAFESKKPLVGLAYNVKTNGKEKKDIRYYINLDSGSRLNGGEAQKSPQTSQKAGMANVSIQAPKNATTQDLRQESGIEGNSGSVNEEVLPF